SIGFLIMLPLFLLRREKYASGFRQRLGNYPEYVHDGRKVIWLHCVSVGETNAARPLVDHLLESFHNHRLVISTTTKTGNDLANKIFADKADAVIYFPFDFKFSVRKALANFKPSLVLLMETEIWPRFIREAKSTGTKIAIVNGRLSAKSFSGYSKVRLFIRRVLADLDLALMQNEADAGRFISLGTDSDKVKVTGNLKFDIFTDPNETELTRILDLRFEISNGRPLIIAASTHEPEEKWVLESLDGELGHNTRLMIAPRHPERFDDVVKLLGRSTHNFVRRTDEPSENDKSADIILLDSIGELRAAYPLAGIVFVGGSLIPHGGQSIYEPASLGKAIVTGPYTANFDDIVKEFLENNAILQLPETHVDNQISKGLNKMLVMLLEDKEKRDQLGKNAEAIMTKSNRGATDKTIELLKTLANSTE
ncbi:MAG: 3-deoxy-D-manno-octulosonic acid transferase, partial [Blastocatellia bacterium]